MPVYEITDPNTGKTLELEGDSPPTEAELNEIFASVSLQPEVAPQPTTPSFRPPGISAAPANPSLGELEAAATIGTGIVAEPVAGIAGLTATPFVGAEEAGKVIEQVREAGTYQPRTQEGQEFLGGLGEVMQPIGEALEFGQKAIGEIASEYSPIALLGNVVTEITGDPRFAEEARAIGGAIGETAPAALLEYIGLRKLQTMRQGTRLLDKNGRPTKVLRKALDKQGLDYDSLSPEAKAAIPETATPDFIPGANQPAKAAEKALIEQIKSGARDDALAGLKVEGGRVAVDKVGKEAVRQGFRPGFVQSVKTANDATKAKMRQMVGIMRRIKKSERVGLETRPSDIVGDAVTERIKYIRNTANDARKELDNIAKTKLSGKDINIQAVTETLTKSLDDLDVRLVQGAKGIPEPVFKGSMISKDKTSQRIIKDVIDLLGEGGRPDALRAHKLKRQLDILIDFKKKSAEGLTDAGKNVLKDIRRTLNDVVREVDPDYARVNDTLSNSLGALDNLDDAVGTIDIFGEGANKALGTRMRALLSNQQGRIKIDNALNTLDDTSAKLGATFDDNIKDLVMFSDGLDNRFGAVAKTSFAGQVEQAASRAVREGVTSTVREKVAEAAGKGAERLKGVNEFNAFESLYSLLKEAK